MTTLKSSVIVTCLVSALCSAAWAQDERVDLTSCGEWAFALEDGEETGPFRSRVPLVEGKKTMVAARIEFEVADPNRFIALEIPVFGSRMKLNGRTVEPPMTGMQYRRYRGLPTSLLNAGKNRFVVIYEIEGKATGWALPEPPETRVTGLLPDALAFQSGPILGCAGPRNITVTCRTNALCRVRFQIADRRVLSDAGVLHRFLVGGLEPDRAYTYFLTAFVPGKDVEISTFDYVVRTLPERGEFSFAVLGDSRTLHKVWKKVAASVVRARPRFSVFVGDMVTDGKKDWLWDVEHFQPAREFFATIPYFAVIGNHEKNCPLFDKIFCTPGGGRRWCTEVAGVLLIGVDGREDWSEDGENALWLEEVLARSEARFKFLFTHYPPWSSGPHGELGDDGKPKEKAVRLARDVILPLMVRHGATALFAGHDHFYERTEPGPVTTVTTGGAGAPLYPAVANEKQNPHSRVRASKNHFCHVDIEGDTATLRVIDVNGRCLDERVWMAK